VNESSGGADPEVIVAAVIASIFISYSHVDKEVARAG
jgi:hypothetical protein